ncbi:uncharacterized protein SPAPADRAFT_51341 [Spathaspora passalidarum NRRL Y-27907]|uniref:Uncharacterized protein n=1 Tax=Spathaspora passalidarum (strain NRRL Y-27907 / 11-Y1) TaxID=619300 RepID=G3ARJ7_SPAPN|nr:uncharacterized protein SPAPADRAFT_51341 [Spathaspora passalidarum NRRL Y-27907]EGW31318.1 hypothetical protein SPAPADRAFT_51341 [Spathaspora passalidarum NRRL Y-27907]
MTKCGLHDLQYFKLPTSLKHLTPNQNQIQDILLYVDLHHLVKLYRIVMKENAISSLNDWILSLNLTYLDLSNNPITELIPPSDEIPEEANLFIDVRDTAKAHIVAFEKEEAIGQRLLLISEPYTYDGIAHIINENFPESRVPKGDLSKDKELKKNVHKYNSSKTNKILGFDFISLEQSIIDSVKEIYESK